LLVAAIVMRAVSDGSNASVVPRCTLLTPSTTYSRELTTPADE
jgi:hypothetical protein